ncbi:MAG: sulfotransferase family 2 domain-containing protein [Candidatus Obscuribacterales bacterium]
MRHTLNRIKGRLQREIESRRSFDRVAIFNHIPKTAGMSFHQFIKDNLPSNSVLDFYTLDNRDRLVEYASQPQSRYAAIVGHLPFSFFVNLTLPAKALHITVLREPVARLISYYYYIRTSESHYLHDWVVNEDISPQAFFESKPTMEIDNLHLRFLCSTDCSNVPIGGCTREMLEEAKDNLKNRFAVVGLQEYFPQSLELTARVMGWKNITNPEINRAPEKSKAAEKDAQTIELIRSMNELDIELYEYGQELFVKKCAELGIKL